MAVAFFFLFLFSLILLSAGLIRPDFFKFLPKDQGKRKKLVWLGTVAVFCFFTLFIFTLGEEVSDNLKTVNKSGWPSFEEQAVNGEIYYQVERVVDGDTIKVKIGRVVQTIRLIGIDSPETADSKRPEEYFGREASIAAKDFLENKKVRLEDDPSQGDKDRYGRLLRYVYSEDEIFFNLWMLENGYAREYTYDTPYKYQEEFKKAEQRASEDGLGLWADGVSKILIQE